MSSQTGVASAQLPHIHWLEILGVTGTSVNSRSDRNFSLVSLALLSVKQVTKDCGNCFMRSSKPSVESPAASCPRTATLFVMAS